MDLTYTEPPLLVVGDSLLDVDLRGVCRPPGRSGGPGDMPVLDAPGAWRRPGGAALAAWLAARQGRASVLATALGTDDAAVLLGELLRDTVTVVRLPLNGGTPVKVRIQDENGTLVRVDHGEGRADGPVPHGRLEPAVRAAGAVLVSDYGRGVADLPAVRAALSAAGGPPVVWDPHPRGPAPPPGTDLVAPNAIEAGTAEEDPGAALRRAEELVRKWGVRSVAVTLGAHGAVWASADGRGLRFPAPAQAPSADTCAAGDRFAACAAAALADGEAPEDAVGEAVQAASRFVVDGAAGAAAAQGPMTGALPVGVGESAHGLAERIRRSGGRVVAAGGCFDLLHAGHVSLLRRARTLGDCLVACVNTDAAVRAAKGPRRPVTPLEDRVRVLSALDCVDAVAVFAEPTPERLLRGLRPDVWVKGADRDPGELPEAAVVEAYGGEVAVLPLLPGRSTTRLVAGSREGP